MILLIWSLDTKTTNHATRQRQAEGIGNAIMTMVKNERCFMSQKKGVELFILLSLIILKGSAIPCT